MVQSEFPRQADDGEATEDGYRARDFRDVSEPAFNLTEKARSWSLRGNQVPPGQDDYHARDTDAPAQTLSGNTGSYRWLRAGTNANDAERAEDEPAPTVRFGDRLNTVEWSLRGNNSVAGEGKAERALDEQSLTVGSRADLWSLRMAGGDNATERPAPAPAVAFGHDAAAVKWVKDRPSTSIVGTFRPDVVTPPGHREWTPDAHRQDAEGSVRIEQHEAAVLQGFPPDYPFQGSKTSRFRQIGDAVPPPLALAVIAALTGS